MKFRGEPFGRACPILTSLLWVSTMGSAAAEESAKISIQGAQAEITFSEPISPELRDVALRWISNSARAVATYMGEFPVRRLRIRIRVGSGSGARRGTTYGYNGALITMSMGRASTNESFADDWLMTHEMFHLGFPSVPQRHHWMEEGISTYVEPIARCRAGLKSAEAVWKEFVDSMPQGLPKSDDRGLDFTPTWGRTYWGGAIFCLRADVEMRKRTHNRMGLEHALRAIVAAGGTIESEWSLDRVIETGDRATGVPVLRELYDEMKAKPVAVDLEVLWREVGVIRRGDTVVFDEGAPHAVVRRAITASR